MEQAKQHFPVNSISAPEGRGSRPSRLKNKKGFTIISSRYRRKDSPLSPLNANADEERTLIYGIHDLNIQPRNSKDDRDSSTNAMCVSGKKTGHIENEDPVSLTVENDNRRVVWSNGIYCRESSIEDVNSIKEGKEGDAEGGPNKVSNPTVTNPAGKGQGKGEDINSSQNENSDVESTASTCYPPFAGQSPTSKTKRETLTVCTEGKNLQCSNKALFCMGDSVSQNVVDATNNGSAFEHKEIGGKDETLVKNDCIDLGIEELEKEISRLTQKLAELKLQKACETTSQLVGIQHNSSDENTPMGIANKVETRNNPREGSSRKKKKTRVVSSKFLQYTSSQPVGIQHNSSDENTPMGIANKVETRNNPREGSSGKKKKTRVVSSKFLQYTPSQPIGIQHNSSDENTPMGIANKVETRSNPQEGSSGKKKKTRVVSSKFLQYTPSQPVGIQHNSSDENTPMGIANKVETRNNPQEGSSGKKKKTRVVSSKFLQYSSKTQPRSEKKIAEMTTKSIASQTSPQIQKKSGSSGPQLRRSPSKVGFVKEDKFKGQKDNVGRQLNQKKIDVSKDPIGDGYSSRRFDGKENISPCLRLLEKNLSLCPDSNFKEVPKDEKNLGKGFPENFKKLYEISENKKFQKVPFNVTVGNCSKVPLGNQGDKVSPARKPGRIIASRYAQITTSNRNSSSPQGSAKLSSQRNVHGKRISTNMEVEDAKARLNNHSSKRPAVGCFVGSPSVKDFRLRNGTLQNSPTPYSITPQGSAIVSGTKKTPSPCLKGGKTTSNLTTVLAGGCRTRTNNQQPVRAKWKEPSKRMNAITAERSINKTFDPSTENWLRGSVSLLNEGMVSVQSVNQSCSAMFQPDDCLQPEIMKLPKMSTFRFTAKSPRDSDCLKSVVDQTGKHPFSSSNGISCMNSIDKRTGQSVSNSSRIKMDESRQILSFENETDTIDLQGF